MWSCSTFLCQGRSFTWIMSSDHASCSDLPISTATPSTETKTVWFPGKLLRIFELESWVFPTVGTPQNMSESYAISWGTSSGSFQRQHFTVLLCMDSTAEVWWAVTVWSSNPVAELQRWNLSVSRSCITSLDCVTFCYNLHQGWSFRVSPRFGKCDGHVFYTDTGSPGAEELRQARWSTPHGGDSVKHGRSRTSFGWVCQLKRWTETKVVGSITGAKSRIGSATHHLIHMSTFTGIRIDIIMTL